MALSKYITPSVEYYNDQSVNHQLLARITALYTHAAHLQQADQHCFTTTLDKWKHRSTHEMKKWLKTNTVHIRECCRQANNHNKQHTRDICMYIPIVQSLPTSTKNNRPTDLQPTNLNTRIVSLVTQ